MIITDISDNNDDIKDTFEKFHQKQKPILVFCKDEDVEKNIILHKHAISVRTKNDIIKIIGAGIHQGIFCTLQNIDEYTLREITRIFAEYCR